jgi:hypothetical protein
MNDPGEGVKEVHGGHGVDSRYINCMFSCLGYAWDAANARASVGGSAKM